MIFRLIKYILKGRSSSYMEWFHSRIETMLDDCDEFHREFKEITKDAIEINEEELNKLREEPETNNRRIH